jgi:serine/threonine protein kinase
MDLHQYHNEIGLSETSAKHVIYGLLCAVSHLHAHSIGHADLKPENIMLTEVPGPDDLKYTHVKLGDFGLCMMACNPSEDSGIHRKGYACGTPGFYAPEMAIQDCFEARQADMWSIGCITLEITLGFPYEWNEAYEAADSDVEEFRMSLESALENINMVLHSSHKQLVEMIFSCLSIDPKKRATSSEALRHPWLAKVASSASESYSSRRISSHWNQLYEDRMNLLSSSALCQ